jgi:hypothetical protein
MPGVKTSGVKEAEDAMQSEEMNDCVSEQRSAAVRETVGQREKRRCKI